jgi:hypothetical protein
MLEAPVKSRLRFLGDAAVAMAAAEFGVVVEKAPGTQDEGRTPDLEGAVASLNSVPLSGKAPGEGVAGQLLNVLQHPPGRSRSRIIGS